MSETRGETETRMMKVCLNIGAIYKLPRVCLQFIKICWWVLMFSDVAGESIVRVPLVQKCVYIGQDAKLYKIDKDFANPSFYGENGIFIASWKGTTSILDKMNSSYSRKFKMDKERNIWIFDVKREDAGNYSVIFGAVHGRLVVEIILNVTDKPTEDHECLDFPTEGNLIGEQIRHDIRKWLVGEIEHIKGFLGNLTGEQFGLIKEYFNRPDFTKEGTNHDTTTAGSKKYYTEGNSNFLNTGLLLALLVIISLDIILKNIFSGTYIRDGWITMIHWIREKFCNEHSIPKQSSQSIECMSSVMVTVDGSEFTEHKVRNWLEGHPEFFENNGSLTESLVRSFLKLHPDFIEKYDEHYHQSKIPSLDELNVTVKDTEMNGIASETGSCQNSDEHENQIQVTPLTFDELGITVKGTEREDNQKRRMSSQEQIVTYETCRSSGSESFRNNSYSRMQCIHTDEKNAASEGDKAQIDSLDKSGKWMKKDPNSDDVSDPLLGKAFNPE